jgi:hypothetical protein
MTLALALALAGCGHGHQAEAERTAAARRAQAEQAARDAGLPVDVQRFLGRAAAAVGQSFTVVYRGPASGTTTLTQRPPERRVDVTGDGTESVLRLRTGTFACRLPTGARGWSCQRRPAGGGDPDVGVFSPDQVSATVAALASAEGTYRFAVASRRLAGTAATCLTAAKPGAAADELCIAPTGAILRIHTARQSVDALRYHPGADAKTLRLPSPA